MRGHFEQVTDVAGATETREAAIQRKARQRVADTKDEKNPKDRVSLEDAISQVEREYELNDRSAEADKINSERTGKGTRVKVGQTRGKNPKVISWEAFDTDKPATLPVTVDEFVQITKAPNEAALVSYLIDGYNDQQYANASDVLGEHVEPNWDDKTVKQFKQSVTNYAAATGLSVEEAVGYLKPGIVKAFNARLAAASATK